MVLTVEMVMVMTRVVCELSSSPSTSPVCRVMRKYLPLFPPDFVTFSLAPGPVRGPGVSLMTLLSSSSLSGLSSLRLEVLEVLEGAVVVEVVVVEGLETGLKVALRSSSQGGMRSLEPPPAWLRLTHL